jgi:hypothetical protein
MKGHAERQRHSMELEVIANVPPEYHCPPVSLEGPSHEDCKKHLELMEKHGNTETKEGCNRDRNTIV